MASNSEVGVRNRLTSCATRDRLPLVTNQVKGTEMTGRMTLGDGRAFEIKVCRNWKSRLVHRLPYGTDLGGVRFEIVR